MNVYVVLLSVSAEDNLMRLSRTWAKALYRLIKSALRQSPYAAYTTLQHKNSEYDGKNHLTKT